MFIHVLMPILSPVARPVLDVSWFGVIMECLFRHDSITVIKLGVLECLRVDLTKCHLLTGKGLDVGRLGFYFW